MVQEMPHPRQMEFNSNDLGESEEEEPELQFESRNSVNCSWKEADKYEEEYVEKMEIQDMQIISKNKNFTFVQSEIDTEIAKNILYSDTGFQPNQNGLTHPEDEQKMSIASKFRSRGCL